MGLVSGDVSNTVLNSAASSGPSIGASSLVTDANSGLSGGPRLQRSASINTESYMRLPASPMSFSSNNISISGSSVMDGSSVVQQTSHQDPSSQQVQQRQQHQGASSATSLPTRMGQVHLPGGPRVPSAFIQDPTNMSHLQKKPRLDIKQEDILQQQDNTIAYWKKFVAEYYSPRAKKRWCLSLYDNVGHQSLGVFPQAAMATFEVLPRLNEIKFGSGVIDEILFLDLPRECRFPSGMMMVEYAKAVQESIYEQLRVVREGQLRIIFSPDLKILSWEFCARRHEELLPRRLIAPQVNQLLQVAQKCQSSIDESGPDGVSPQDLQANSVMVVTAGRQLARSLELQSVNDLGFSKRYVRCLQIAEVVNSMKDLMDFCREQKVGPIDGLKDFLRHTTAAKIQTQKMQEMEQMGGLRGLPTDHDTFNKLMALHPGLNTQMNNNQHMVGRKPLTGSAQGALALTNYQNMLMRQNSMNSNHNSLQQEASSSFNNSNLVPSSTFRGSSSGNLPGNLQNLPTSGFSSSHVLQQHQQQRASSGNGLLQQNQPQPFQCSQSLQQQMIQQYLQDMSNKNNGSRVSQQAISMQGASGSVTRDGPGFRNTTSAATAPSANGSGNDGSNSFKTASHSESSAGGGNYGLSQKASDLPLSGEMVHDIVHEFTENGFFDSDIDEMNYS
ncbi:putative transcriptional regulator SLK2 [Forsythia ovata]|uniref:Transcriptional regulator SLK2 n=1 Tax=Forsythia ovata TaxID=205694 RepID=A0ABD1X657_9LAMI